MTPINQKFQSVIEGLLPSRVPFKVLEAGCGSASYLSLNPHWELTGIDLSESQLKKILFCTRRFWVIWKRINGTQNDSI